MPPQYALAYLDDIIVFSRSVEEHLAQLRKVLEVHRQFGMKLKLSKCRVLQTEVEYLGHLVSEEGIQMIPGYVQKIVDWHLPQTGEATAAVSGICGLLPGFHPQDRRADF